MYLRVCVCVSVKAEVFVQVCCLCVYVYVCVSLGRGICPGVCVCVKANGCLQHQWKVGTEPSMRAGNGASTGHKQAQKKPPLVSIL